MTLERQDSRFEVRGKGCGRRKDVVMGQFEIALADFLAITIRAGIPLAILFLIGYMIRMWHERR